MICGTLYKCCPVCWATHPMYWANVAHPSRLHWTCFPTYIGLVSQHTGQHLYIYCIFVVHMVEKYPSMYIAGFRIHLIKIEIYLLLTIVLKHYIFRQHLAVFLNGWMSTRGDIRWLLGMAEVTSVGSLAWPWLNWENSNSVEVNWRGFQASRHSVRTRVTISVAKNINCEIEAW